VRAPEMVPRPSGGVAHTVAVPVTAGSTRGALGDDKRRVFPPSDALDCGSNRPDDPVLFLRRNVARQPATFARSRSAVPSRQTMPEARHMAASTLAHRTVTTRWITLDAPAITMTMLHLCSSQCKALRFAPPARTARPSGLDGACAQMISGHLRDGRRMLLPSGTEDALIERSATDAEQLLIVASRASINSYL
jgi:hypothetical protein